MSTSPFDLNNETAYQHWREQKLHDYPRNVEDLIIEVNDPRDLSDSEYQALLSCCQKSNLVIYAGKTGDNPDKAIPAQLAQRFGLQRLNSNWLADDDGISALTVSTKAQTQKKYIPYTNKAIQWHTDGYYNSVEQQINGMVLHCVQPAQIGGENDLLDPEIVYMLLRDANPEYIHALMQTDVLTIPPRESESDDKTVERATETGAVFSIHPQSQHLHMRYTVRKYNVQWKQDALTQAALAQLTQILNSDLAYKFQAKLGSGMGLLCNNVLHTRHAFDDDSNAHQRLLYRARYFDRIHNT